MKLAALKKKDFPEPLPLNKLVGPSFILLGLGLGSGELILWPYLSSNFGLGIIWGAVIGITLQFFLNMEVARYTLVNGESVFVGLARKLGIFSPLWFILSTLVPWMWPGIIASSATVFAVTLGIPYSKYVGVVLLVAIGVILSLGPVIYKTQEKFQKAIILIGVPFVIILASLIARPSDIGALFQGIFGKGEGYWFLPEDIPLATFLAALAYAGAGGNLNLSQSFYVKEKGYGMGKFAGRLTSLITGKSEALKLEGTTFNPTTENVNKFNVWWKRINIEHLIVFWGTGTVTMLVLSLLSYSTVHGQDNIAVGVRFVIEEAATLGSFLHPFVGSLFLLTTGLMLFGTQFSVFASTSRIMSENLILVDPSKFKIEGASKYFYFFLWLQIFAGVVILLAGFTEPLTLVIVGAVLNAFTMFVYSGLLVWLNLRGIQKTARPSLLRRLALTCVFLFYGGFTFFTLLQYLR